MKKLVFLLSMIGLGLSSRAADESKLSDGLYAEFDTTKGKIVAKLEYEKTPLTVANFVGLAEGTKHYSNDGSKPAEQKKPFYDGIKFHRVIPDFMVQVGDPLSRTDDPRTGSGGPGYRFKDEVKTGLKHDRPGTLSMANAGPGTNGSQIFITHLPTPHLDGRHTVFGYVTQGQDVVNAIVKGDSIKGIKIIRIGEKAKAFKTDEAAWQALNKQ